MTNCGSKTLRFKRRALLMVFVLLLLTVGQKAHALTPEEAKRYGYSDSMSRDKALSPQPTKSADPFNPELIPSPTLQKLAPREVGIPKPRRKDGKLSPLPEIKPAVPGHRLPKLPPPMPSINLQYKKVGDAKCLSCHPGHDKNPKRGHLSFLRNAPHFKGKRDMKSVKEYREKKKRHRRNRRRRERAGKPGVRKEKAPTPPRNEAAKAGCESCHGPGNRHVLSKSLRHIFSFKKASYDEANNVCMGCHYMQKRISQHEWKFGHHAAARVKCTDCHTEHKVNHQPMLKDRPNRLCLKCHKSVEASFAMRSHHPVKDERFQPLRGALQRSKLRCFDCHNPHGRLEDHRMVRRGRKEGCVRCHPAKRGPFFYEHRVSFDRKQACLECHLPHGSPNRGLLMAPGRALCLRCHANRVAHKPGQSCYTSTCHRAVHGSNRDSLLRR